MKIDIATKRAAREAILKLIYQKHERQEHRYDDQRLLFALDQLSFRLYLDAVHTLLQELSDSRYVTYSENREQLRKNGELYISDIQLTPDGRKIVEKLKRDPSIGLDE